MVKSYGDCTKFKQHLTQNLQKWFLLLPFGIGKATGTSIIKSFFTSKNPGIDSAGNGPIMRLGAISYFYSKDPIKRHEFVKQSTKITHNNLMAVSA